MPELVLVGAPGAGKSTVGALLAINLGVDFVDVDAVIEDAEGRPITEIFAERGEQGFRELERATTVAQLDGDAVLALGGGAVTNPAVRAALAGHRVVWLRVGVDDALTRLGSGATRPLLAGDVAGKWQTLVERRAQLYAEVATLIVDTDGFSPSQVAELVLAALAAKQESQ